LFCVCARASQAVCPNQTRIGVEGDTGQL